ncbi:hypothetical protein BDV40DRAFT_305293 [Aspergillus tamarii]|uniref:Transcription factor domain-containing protein n=1 Tax=Aspergillus tamarii TaxID=41984 RepID=A0A5N6UFA4_ASPTM|nr:hypothetical protein BDV40DRAFT_305293 [Aspergillus tamarii]
MHEMQARLEELERRVQQLSDSTPISQPTIELPAYSAVLSEPIYPHLYIQAFYLDSDVWSSSISRVSRPPLPSRPTSIKADVALLLLCMKVTYSGSVEDGNDQCSLYMTMKKFSAHLEREGLLTLRSFKPVFCDCAARTSLVLFHGFRSNVSQSSPFARLGQAASFLGRVIIHCNNPAPDIEHVIDNTELLFGPLTSLLDILAIDDHTGPQSSNVVTTFCFSALLKLSEHHSCVEFGLDGQQFGGRVAPRVRALIQRRR